MKSKRVVALWVLFLSLTLLAGLFAATGSAAEEKVLKVGCSLPLSGPGGAWGIPVYRGNQVIVDMINDRGGVKIGGDTYTIEYIAEDNKFTPGGAVAAAEKLVTRDKVVFITGGVVGHVALATASVTDKNNMIYSHTAYAPELVSDQYPRCIRWSSGPAENVVVVYAYARKAWPNAKRVAFFGTENPSSRNSELLVRKFAPHVGMEMVYADFYEMGVKDFMPLLLKVLKAEPDIIESSGTNPPDHALIVKQARSLGYKGQFACISPMPEKELIEIAGAEASEGFTSYGFPVEGPMASDSAQELFRKYKEKHGDWNSIAAITNFVEPVVRAMEVAGTIDTNKVMKVIESGQEFNLLYGGRTVFNQEELYRVAHQGVFTQYIHQMRNGKGVFVDSVSIDDQLKIFKELGWKWEDIYGKP